MCTYREKYIETLVHEGACISEPSPLNHLFFDLSNPPSLAPSSSSNPPSLAPSSSPRLSHQMPPSFDLPLLWATPSLSSGRSELGLNNFLPQPSLQLECFAHFLLPFTGPLCPTRFSTSFAPETKPENKCVHCHPDRMKQVSFESRSEVASNFQIK